MSNLKRNRGFSLVELMIGLLIGAVAILVVTQLAVTFEGQKRSTVGSAESMDEGAIALYTLGREIQSAGYGLVDGDLIGCNIRVHSELVGAPAGAQDFFISLFPVRIAKGAQNVPDSIIIMTGNSGSATEAVYLTQTYNGDTANIVVSNRYGFELGNAFILSHPLSERNTLPLAQQNCSMHQVTALPGTSELQHLLEYYTPPGALAGYQESSKWNSAAGPGPNYTYSTGAKVFNLGSGFGSMTYTVCTSASMGTQPCVAPRSPGELVATDNMATDASAKYRVLMENVVMIKAQYGVDIRPNNPPDIQVNTYSDGIPDVNGDGRLMAFDNTGFVTTNDPDDYMRIGAIRLAIVTRSKYPDKPDPQSGVCSATLPNWGWDSITDATVLTAMLPAGADWRCYKYKVFQTTIPLRNMLWRIQSS